MFKVEAITPAIGAEISGVYLNQALVLDTIQKIYDVIQMIYLFRNQIQGNKH